MSTGWIIAAIIVGGAIGTYFGVKQKPVSSSKDTADKQGGKNDGLGEKGIPWECLMKYQKSLDELTISDILAWIEGFESDLKEGDTIFLFKATKSNVLKLGYIFPEQIDCNTNVIGSVVNTESSDVKNTQLFTFGGVSEKVDELFAGDDYAVITV